MAGEGANRLARELDGRMARRAEGPPPIGFGTVQDGMALKLDHFPAPIPRGAYETCRAACVDPQELLDAARGPGGGRAPLRLRPGDRVLVAWAGGAPAVVDRLMRQEEME